MQELIITKELTGGRLDKMISKYLDKAPKSFVYKMLRKKNIELNGKKAGGNEILKEGDSIRFFLSDETICKFQSSGTEDRSKRLESLELNASWNEFETIWKISSMIVYEDDQIIALNKPAGLLSQKAKPEDISLNELIADHLRTQATGYTEPKLFTPGISNRLDRNTSGLVLAGKNPAASRELNSAIRERRLKKFYLCLVKGIVRSPETVDGFLLKDMKTNQVRIFRSLENPENQADFEKNAARIQTAYEPVCCSEELTLLKVDLITGKSHQIRAHLASIGHPIIGDSKYGDAALNKAFQKTDGLKRQLLHAEQIQFTEMKGILEYLNGKFLKAPLPEDFERICSQLNISC